MLWLMKGWNKQAKDLCIRGLGDFERTYEKDDLLYIWGDYEGMAVLRGDEIKYATVDKEHRHKGIMTELIKNVMRGKTYLKGHCWVTEKGGIHIGSVLEGLGWHNTGEICYTYDCECNVGGCDYYSGGFCKCHLEVFEWKSSW